MPRHYRISDLLGPAARFPFHIGSVTLSHPSFELHTHDFSELVVVLGGEGWHLVDQQRFRLQRGDVFVINPRTVHGFEDARGLNLCNLTYDAAQMLTPRAGLEDLPGYHALFILQPSLHGSGFGGRFRLGANAFLQARRMIQSMEDEFQRRQPGWQSMLAAGFMQLVVHLSREASARPASEPDPLARLARVVSHMNLHTAEPLSIAELARLAHMSPNSLFRWFRRCYGSSPADYLIRLRLRMACELMADPALSLTEIAFRVGFNDSNYFTRQFRRVLGQSPRSWRKANAAEAPSRPAPIPPLRPAN